MKSFSALGVSDAVARALSARGITSPFPVQERVLPDGLAGRDLLVRSPTGSGKSLAFGLALVERLEANAAQRPSALVLVPTRELASQIVEEIREAAHARALKVAAVYGGAGIHKQATAARKAHILVATPGRLEDLLQRGDITLKNVSILVLDEADRMLDMGFQPAVERIVNQTRKDRQTLLFSATLDGNVERLAKKFTRDARRHEQVDKVGKVGDVEHRFLTVDHTGKLDALVRELKDADRTLVFVRTKRGADRLVKRLKAANVSALAMHGDKTQGQRERALASFTDGRTPTLVATDVAARGIDVDDISHVINFDIPGAHEDYVHRVGRTGRAGRNGVGITFVVPDQHGEMKKMARALDLSDEFSQARGRR